MDGDSVRTVLNWGAAGTFWVWNSFLVLIYVFGVAPFVLPELLYSTWLGLTPVSFTLWFAFLFAIPVGGLAVAIHVEGRAESLLNLFYGIQIPLMVGVIARLGGVSEVHGAMGLLLAGGAAGIGGLVCLMVAGPQRRSKTGQALHLIAQAVFWTLGLWFATVLSAWLLPVCWGMVSELPSLRFGDLAGLLVVVSVLLVVLGSSLIAPFATFAVATRSLVQVYRASMGLGAWRFALTAGAVACFVSATVIAAQQPQHQAATLIEAGTAPQARAGVLAQQEVVREGLLNAYLAEYRYLAVAEAHQDAPLADRLLDLSLWPVLYRPVVGRYDDEQWAKAQYARFFDRPIERAERKSLVASIEDTWQWQQAQAAMLDIGQERVHLDSQELRITEHGDHATLLIHDVYRNRTTDRQEVLLSFSLPEGAVVSGLWLGETPSREEAFQHTVAPRGAAQEVYEREVVRRVDPALLEQVGPRQYRLRAFPVLPKKGTRGDLASFAGEGPAMHVWIQVDVWAEERDGGMVWPLPVQTEVRNLYWSGQTGRALEGQPFVSDEWLPSAVPTGPEALPQAHARVLGRERVSIGAERLPVRGMEGRRVGVFVDESYSMGAHATQVQASLELLHARTDLDLVMLGDLSGVYYGLEPLGPALARVQDQTKALDAVIVLTDSGSYELSQGAPVVPTETSERRWSRTWELEGNRPSKAASEPLLLPELWMVHFGGFPQAYNDQLLDAILESGGGVAASTEEALAAMAQEPQVVQGRPVRVELVTEVEGTTEVEAIDRLLAAQLVAYRVNAGGVEGEDWLARLDALHADAVRYDLVTPWSSMIVLVNDRQRLALEQASGEADRFEREVLNESQISATPEPEEWALILLALGIGIWMFRKGRGAGLRGSDSESRMRV